MQCSCSHRAALVAQGAATRSPLHITITMMCQYHTVMRFVQGTACHAFNLRTAAQRTHNSEWRFCSTIASFSAGLESLYHYLRPIYKLQRGKRLRLRTEIGRIEVPLTRRLIPLAAWQRSLLLLSVGVAIGALFSTVNAPRRGTSTQHKLRISAGSNGSAVPTAVQADRAFYHAQHAVKEITTLGSCGQSSHGKRYRSLICTIVRNDLHLREFIVRHLLLGFCHIVVYDNNQVLRGRDHDITPVVEPFVKQGVVTHIPYLQNTTGLLPEAAKDEHVFDCIRRFGHDADWIASLDSDEYLYIARKPQSAETAAAAAANTVINTKQQGSTTQQQQQQGKIVNTISAESASSGDMGPASVGNLDAFLADVESQTAFNNTCALSMPWQMMYGEHRVLKGSQLLLDSYPRLCFTSRLPKLLFVPGRAKLKPPHYAKCIGVGVSAANSTVSSLEGGTGNATAASSVLSVDSDVFKQSMGDYEVHLVHYYTKSVEEYILKSEQSIPPWFRLLQHSYDTAKQCELRQMPYDELYVASVRTHIAALRAAAAAAGGGEGGMQNLGFAPNSHSGPAGNSSTALDNNAQATCIKPVGNCMRASSSSSSDGGKLLSLPPESKPLSRADYALYVFLKLKITHQQEWDEAAYLANNPAAVRAMEEHRFVDGLHHFLTVGFYQNATSCWVGSEGEHSCIS